MNTINIKPLSVNEAWQGRRFKTNKYKMWLTELSFILPKIVIPEGKLKVTYELGFSNAQSDIDNPVKCLTDALQFKYGFNDKMIYKLEVEKVIVPKGKEYISFDITSLNE